ncbi:hypothetical protein CF328_g3943 [Tilletia controversa]|nr:hypothetical protein CF328_g3943 [Tilletia controversa]
MGRWKGPLSRAEVERLVGPFQTSPLGIIPKANGDVRLVQDFSWPREGPYASINAFIDSDEFITAWDGVRAVIDSLLKLDPNVEGASMDGKDAFRTCLAKPSQWPGLVVQTSEEVFFLDLFLPFGLVLATGVWGLVADATRSIIVKRMCGRVVILKWIDDFLVLRTDPAVCLDDVRTAADGLDFAWNEAKTADFSPRPIYIGWEWRIKERKVVLPRTKAESYRGKAAEFQFADPQSLEATQTLLQHVAFVARDLSPYLMELARFAATFPVDRPYMKLHVPEPLRNDMTLWVRALAETPFIRSFDVPEKVFPDDVWVDASTEWGLGVVIGERWSAWKWRPGWQSESRHIGWAEAVALELGLLAALACGASRSLIRFWSDNHGVIGEYKKGRSFGRQANTVLKRVLAVEKREMFRLDIRYIESVNNPADAPSRGELLPGQRLPSFKIPPPRTTLHRRSPDTSMRRLLIEDDSSPSTFAARGSGGSNTNRGRAETAFIPTPGSVFDTPAELQLRRSLFPNIPTLDRLLTWRPGVQLSFSLQTSSGVQLPNSKTHQHQVLRALRSSIEPNTRQQYGSAIGIFLAAVFDMGLAAADIFPLSEGLLLAFVGSCCGNRAVGTVKNYLAALSCWHRMWGQPWVIFPMVTQALKGVAKLAPLKKPLRAPIETVDLLAVRSFLSPTTDHLHAAVWSCALFSFFAVCRLSETTSPSAKFVDPSRHVTRDKVEPVRSVAGAAAIEVRLPWTKTTWTDGASKILSEAPGLLDPVHALLWHLSFIHHSRADPSVTTLFSYKVRAGRGWRLVPLTKDTFLAIFSDALRQAGRPSFQGHSFRIGGACFYWHKGATVPEIKLLGGWSSESFKIYLRDPLRGLVPVQQRLLLS